MRTRRAEPGTGEASPACTGARDEQASETPSACVSAQVGRWSSFGVASSGTTALHQLRLLLHCIHYILCYVYFLFVTCVDYILCYVYFLFVAMSSTSTSVAGDEENARAPGGGGNGGTGESINGGNTNAWSSSGSFYGYISTLILVLNMLLNVFIPVNIFIFMFITMLGSLYLVFLD